MKTGKVIRKILGGILCVSVGMILSLVWFILGLAFGITTEKEGNEQIIEEGTEECEK